MLKRPEFLRSFGRYLTDETHCRGWVADHSVPQRDLLRGRPTMDPLSGGCGGTVHRVFLVEAGQAGSRTPGRELDPGTEQEGGRSARVV